MLRLWKRKLCEDYKSAREYSSSLRSLSEEEIPAAQLSKLQAVWKDAIVDVPYYRNLVRAGMAPEAICSWNDFHRLPEVNRTLLQAHAEEFKRISGQPDFSRTTGGSTGNPVRLGMWKSEDSVLRMLKLALWSQMGYSPEDRLFLIWGHAHLLGSGWARVFNQAQRTAKDWLAGYRRANAYILSPERCAAMAREMLAFKPAGLIGYAAALDYFARTTEQFHPAFRRLQLRFVMPCAEPPPRPDTFEVLRATFGAPIVQEFGGVDFGQVGMKIDERPFQIFSDHNILESIPNQTMQASPEAALVTALYRRYMPLIRYRQGDLLHGVRRLENGHIQEFDELAGRENDMLALPAGGYVHSEGFMHCLRDEAAIINAQLVVSDKNLVLRVVMKDGVDDSWEQRVRERLGRLSPELRNVEIVQAIDLDTSIAGKRRWFIDRRLATNKN